MRSLKSGFWVTGSLFRVIGDVRYWSAKMLVMPIKFSSNGRCLISQLIDYINKKKLKTKADYIEWFLETSLIFLLCHRSRQAHKLLQFKEGAIKDT